MTHWLDRIGIDKTCRLVAMCRGCIVLTTTPDGTHTLWLFNHPIVSGDAKTIRNRYADYIIDHWLEPYYRS